MAELIVALILILLNGVFSLSELAVVSARKSRLRMMAEQRKAGARAALALAEEPGRFLSTVQIGITLIGVLSGAFSGATLGHRMTDILRNHGLYILDAIAGAFRADNADLDPEAIRREDGSWLLSGSMPVDEMADLLRITLPARREYQTVGGLVIASLQRLPSTGEATQIQGWRFEVVDMDGRRIDKVLAVQAA
ncbi:transporter associated domain-containing protein [Methylorubrum extorquens]